MRHFFAALLLLLVCSFHQTARAQAGDAWVNVAPASEHFAVQMPQTPTAKTQKNSFAELNVDTRIYTATSDDVEYTVWSLTSHGFKSASVSDHLDLCAELVWESLLKPLRDSLLKDPRLLVQMSYQGKLYFESFPGREYSLNLGKRSGLVHIFYAGLQTYVLTVLNADAESGDTQRFFSSFSFSPYWLPVAPEITKPITGGGVGEGVGPETGIKVEPTTGGGVGAGIGPGTGGGVGTGEPNGLGRGSRSGDPVAGAGLQESAGAASNSDWNRTFSGKEVTEKAQVLSRIVPAYSLSARKYQVVGTVVLRAVISKSGEVTNIRIVNGLPHGLTKNAIDAARQSKFSPASKDGRAVAQYVQLEYDFNLK